MLARPILLALLAIQLTRAPRAECASSYIDDYFLPTAKLALNKIQQSFSPPQQTTTATSTTPTTATSSNHLNKTNVADVEAISSAANSINVQPADRDADHQSENRVDREPSSVVYYQPAGDRLPASQAKSDESATNSNKQEEDLVTLSSTESISTDPTSAQAATEDLGSPDSSSSTTGASTTTTTEGSPSSSTTAASLVQTDEPTVQLAQLEEQSNSINALESKSADESSFKETELKAIAAVDESIAFGDLMLSRDSMDTCYDEYGNARFCEPEFENVAFERPVEVSSECGSPPTRFCTTTYSTTKPTTGGSTTTTSTTATGASKNERNDQIRNCHICDSQHPKKRHPAAYLTDINDSDNPTCWVSAPIGLKVANGSQSPGDSAAAIHQQRDNVTLTLSLGKSYEITYVSLQFCSLKPDSLAIYRSSTNGLTWSAYQFYSSQCRQLYGMEAWNASGGHELEAVCVNSSQLGASNQLNSGRIAFSTLEGRQAAKQPELAADQAKLSDWISATDIKIVLDRHQASWIQSSLAVHSHHSHSWPSPSNLTTPTKLAAQQQPVSQPNEQPPAPLDNLSQLTNPSDTYNYALSDLTVGGRCKCNGHAQRCVHDKDGQLTCDCRHNTAGRDCERCAPFHFDRPWQPATQLDASPCQPCQCNGHSRKCRFDPDLYQSSGRRSGGVCMGCRDNTAGRHCHYCREGYTRDHTKPMSDKDACKLCNCHPVGSSGRVCNQTSGQCPCKEGVTGLECTRCAPGYQQSSSPSEPCIKLPENDINSYEPMIELTDQDEQPASVHLANGNNNEPDSAQPSDAELAPPAAARPQPNGAPKPPEEAGPTAADEKPMEEPAYQRPARPRYQPANGGQGGGQWAGARRPPPGRHEQPYYYGEQQYARRQPQLMGAADDQNEADDYPDYRQGYFARRLPVAGPKKAGRQNGAKAHQHQHQHQHPMPMVDVNSVDEMSGAADLQPGANYAPLDTDNEPMDQFNQINDKRPLGGAGRGPPKGPMSSYSRGRQPAHSSSRRRFQEHGQQQHPQQPFHRAPSAINCADCQAPTRRFRKKEFCHLDYAIKALVVGRVMAEDWTRYEVEILDIFKSAKQPVAANSLDDNLLQSDDPSVVAPVGQPKPIGSSANETVELAGDNENNNNSNSNNNDQQQMHAPRMKIGSVHSIWVPTEDVSCKCPRLKLESTYLLSGHMDKSEHSPAAIQLDRHGVALLWKASLQERLIKYQRRQLLEGC